MTDPKVSPALLAEQPGSIFRKNRCLVKIDNLTPTRKADIRLVSVRVDGAERSFRGRYAWTLLRLIEAGDQGCTPVEVIETQEAA